jgi:hypothetical protein
MRFAYADPPYPRQSKKHYEDHPDYAGEVDHRALVKKLLDEFPDGWALSTNPGELRWLLPLVPERHRVLSWRKPFAAWKRNHWPAYAWEPVILVGGRTLYGTQETPRDWYQSPENDWLEMAPPDDIPESMTLGAGVSGAKPLAFCLWLFACAGLTVEDELIDLFPGSGAVGHAWMTYRAQQPLAFPSQPKGPTLFEEDAA